tara:strand:- start:560 stop:700 length:141 start_codon:yes stop_codon:yes gene_type:complete
MLNTARHGIDFNLYGIRKSVTIVIWLRKFTDITAGLNPAMAYKISA